MLPGLKEAPIKFGELMMYAVLVLKHLRLMVLILAFSLLLGLAVYVYVRPVYYTRSVINAYLINPIPVTTQQVYGDSVPHAVLAAFSTTHIVESTAARYGVKATEKQIFDRYLKKVLYQMNSEGNIEVQVWAYNKDMAATWSKELLTEFLEYREQQRVRRRGVVLDDFAREMVRINSKMEEWMANSYKYHDSNKVAALSLTIRQLQNVPVELMRTGYQIGEMDRVRERMTHGQWTILEKIAILSPYANNVGSSVGDTISMATDGLIANAGGVGSQASKGSSPAQVIVLPSTIESPVKASFSDLELKYRDLLQRRVELSKVFLPAHPKMRQVDAELKDVERSLDVELQSLLNRFDLRYSTLVDKQKDLEKKLPQYDDANREMAKLQLGIDNLSAGELGWRGLYNSLARSQKTMEYGEDMELYRFEYLGNLEERLDPPLSPNRLTLAVYSLLLGTVIAIGVPFLLEYLDHTINSIEVGENAFKLRGLGVVPELRIPQNLLLASGNGDEEVEPQLEENFRVIRTNMLMSAANNGAGQVIMIASATPQEGKSMVATNLALSFARRGEKVLLMDADVRRGRLHRVADQSSSPGLSEVLRKMVPLADALRATSHPGLTLLPRGEYTEGVTELVGGPAIATVLEQLRRQFDRIIIDTPPVLGLAETSALQSSVDGVVFVIWSGRTPVRNVKLAVDTLRSNRARFYGFVLNRLDLSGSSNYYYYYYYSSQYYQNYRLVEPPKIG